jgi:hypothetical protein
VRKKEQSKTPASSEYRKNRIYLGTSDVPVSGNFRENIFKLIDIKT